VRFALLPSLCNDYHANMESMKMQLRSSITSVVFSATGRSNIFNTLPWATIFVIRCGSNTVASITKICIAQLANSSGVTSTHLKAIVSKRYVSLKTNRFRIILRNLASFKNTNRAPSFFRFLLTPTQYALASYSLIVVFAPIFLPDPNFSACHRR